MPDHDDLARERVIFSKLMTTIGTLCVVSRCSLFENADMVQKP